MLSHKDITFYLTPAIRAFMVNSMVPEQEAQDLLYAFLQLGYPKELLQLSAQQVRPFIKEELCQLILQQTPEAEQMLVHICENIVQFYLIGPHSRLDVLERLNAMLPNGLEFSPISGRLLFRSDSFYQENPFLDEERNLYLNAPDLLQDAEWSEPSVSNELVEMTLANVLNTPPAVPSEPVKVPLAPVAETVAPVAETVNEPTPEPIKQGEPKTEQKLDALNEIRNRRLKLLQKLQTGMNI